MMVEDHACKGNLAEQRWLDVDDSSPAMKPIDAKQTELTSYTVVLAYCPNIHRLYIGIYVVPRERVPSRQLLDHMEVNWISKDRDLPRVGGRGYTVYCA
jgi:hypothetical protein